VRLQLPFNCLSQLSGISALSQSLQQLDLSHNRLTSSSIQELSTLQGLTECWLGHNRISSVEALAALPNLQFLALHNNIISTAADVLQLSALSRLRHLTLCHNPVCKQQHWHAATVSMMPALQVCSPHQACLQSRGVH
jgi:Leucine-rich repeat (LRR) protein